MRLEEVEDNRVRSIPSDVTRSLGRRREGRRQEAGRSSEEELGERWQPKEALLPPLFFLPEERKVYRYEEKELTEGERTGV